MDLRGGERLEDGQSRPSANSWNCFLSTFGASASVCSSILVMANPSPTFSRCALATVWTASRREAGFGQTRGQGHGEAGRVRRGEQLFGVAPLAVLKTGRERVGAGIGAAAQFEGAAAFFDSALPFSFGVTRRAW